MAGTLLAGCAMGKAANWGANKLKNLASKALPKLKTAVQEGAERLANQFRKGFGTSGSGQMNRNRGVAVNPFYKGGKKTGSRFPENPDDLFPENYAGLTKEVKGDGKINYTIQAGEYEYIVEFRLPNFDPDTPCVSSKYSQPRTFAPGDLLPTKNH